MVQSRHDGAGCGAKGAKSWGKISNHKTPEGNRFKKPPEKPG